MTMIVCSDCADCVGDDDCGGGDDDVDDGDGDGDDGDCEAGDCGGDDDDLLVITEALLGAQRGNYKQL